MMRMKKWLAFLAAVCFLLPGFAAAAKREAADEATILAIAQGVVDWKKRDNGSPADGFLLTPSFLEEAGTPAGDWYPIGLGRLGIEDNNEGYLAVIAEKVSQRYQGRKPAGQVQGHRMASDIPGDPGYGRRPHPYRGG